jgi:hypothetical protein
MIEKLLQEGVNVTVAVPFTELEKLVDYTIAKAKKELEESIVAEKTETYLTTEKVIEILTVDRSTLWRWKKRGYLVPVDVGGKHRYKKSDIKKILK